MNPTNCASQHFGKWAIEPQWFAQAVSAVRAGTWAIGKPSEPLGYTIDNGVAVLPIEGHMTKGRSSFGGTSTVEARRAMHKAMADDSVKQIVLSIDSPGGTVDGTADLADAVRDSRKPVTAVVNGMAASAAYWVASQASRIYAGRTDRIGSIGTYAVLEDTTGMMDKAGVKMHVVSSGPYKGLGADGSVTPELIEDVQREVNDINEHFLAAVADGREMDIAKVRELADGRVHVGEKAQVLGLIDGIKSLEDVIKEIHMDNEIEKLRAENAKLLALADAATRPATATELKGAISDAGFIIDQLAKNATLADAKAAYADVLAGKLAEANAKIAKLECDLAKATTGQSAVAFVAPEPPKDETPQTPQQKAKQEWDAMNEDQRQAWISEDIFVRARVRQQAA